MTTYSCNYFDQNGKRLVIRNQFNDTFSVFSLAKNSIRQYLNNDKYFTVTTKGKKYLLTKDFRQHSFNDYAEIRAAEESGFFVTQVYNEAEVLITGLVNDREEQIIPYSYTDISFNTQDSLIIACAANTLPHATDDVFDYKGKKVQYSRRHIVMATKDFLIQKMYEPKEYYIFLNLQNNAEASVVAEDVHYYQGNEVLIKIKNDWYIYDLKTNQKKLKGKT